MSSEGKEGAIELGKLTNNSASLDDKQVNTLGSAGGEEKGKITEEGGVAKDELIPKEDLDKHVEVKQGFLRRCRQKCSSSGNKKAVGFETNPNLRIKNTIKRIVNGRFVLTLMTFVTIFALIGVSISNNNDMIFEKCPNRFIRCIIG